MHHLFTCGSESRHMMLPEQQLATVTSCSPGLTSSTSGVSLNLQLVVSTSTVTAALKVLQQHQQLQQLRGLLCGQSHRFSSSPRLEACCRAGRPGKTLPRNPKQLACTTKEELLKSHHHFSPCGDKGQQSQIKLLATQIFQQTDPALE